MTLRTTDQQRAARLLLTYLDNNKAGFDAVLGEAAGDPNGGVAGLLFAMTAVAADVATVTNSPSEVAQQIERALLTLDRRAEHEQGDED
jgi:hypothetical protein